MATVIDSLVISLGLDPTPVKSGLNQLAGLAAKFAGPIAGAFSINKIVSGYMKDVGEVARMTGRYSQKLEEWRYKRAMLARVTREDIDLYKNAAKALSNSISLWPIYLPRSCGNFIPRLKWASIS
jgi:hypothetical protein